MATLRQMLTTALSVLLVASMASAASVRSTNFVVEAPTIELAQEFAKLAEQYRKQKAMEWLGREMPAWEQPCPLKVIPTMSGAKGATTFEFPNGQVVTKSMFVEGPIDRLKFSVLPHEVTHTVLSHYFRRPVPRWADEGGSVFSEDELERSRHDKMCRQILNAGRGMPLRRLFKLTQYPDDVMVLYAQGYSVTKFLVEASDRQTFLNFIGAGMQWGWDEAAKTHYGFRNVDEMEQSWLDYLRKGGTAAVARTPGGSNPDSRLTVRQNVPPAMPLLDPQPVSRGLAPSPGRERETFGGTTMTSSQPRPAAQLGDPLPLSPMNPRGMPTAATPVSSSGSVSGSGTPRNAPPPVILFPPEPLPLR